MDNSAIRLLHHILDQCASGDAGTLQFEEASQHSADLALLQWIISCYGLKHIAYVTTDMQSRKSRNPVHRVTYSRQWQDFYRETFAEHQDPAIKRGLSEVLPFEWGNFEPENPQQNEFLDRVRDFGIGKRGFSIPIRDRSGARALVTMTVDRTGKNWSRYDHVFRKELVGLAYLMHERFSVSPGLRKPLEHETVTLTPRERDVLQWAAFGKNIEDIGSVLGIARRSVEFHMTNAKQKLDSLTVSQAVAKATVRQLILPIH